ncbi:MAG: DUF3892 domain-containing protein [Cyanobacteria bacterium P01_D01_bin.105]
MTEPRKVVDARKDEEGNISHVKLNGNQNFTSVEKAIEMADQGKISNAHSVHEKNGSSYLRTNPDGKASNNLDTMADS